MQFSRAGDLPPSPPSPPSSSPSPPQFGDFHFECSHYNAEQVRLLSRSLLLALSAACVEKTYGDPFKTPLSVAADMRKELIEYLLRFTPSNLASVTSSYRAPLESAQDLLDAFILSKTSFFSRLSSKFLIGDDAKEDRIEDFLEELDFTETWICSHREQVAKMLLRKLDLQRHRSICGTRFGSESELEKHRLVCGLRPITCGNEGCGHILSAIHVPDHDRSCAYKLLPCEQRCGAMVIRSEMDKHCVTVCPMRPVKCSFSHVGCNAMVPYQNLERHCEESVDAHHALALKIAQQREMLASNLAQQILVLEKTLSMNQRQEAVDVGTLSPTVRQQDVKIKALAKEASKVQQELKGINAVKEDLQLQKLHKQNSLANHSDR